MDDLLCSECHNTFTPNAHNQLTCGPTCYQKRCYRRHKDRRRDKIIKASTVRPKCVICHDNYIPKDRLGKSWTCSKECANEKRYQSRAWNNYIKQNEKIEQRVRRCSECKMYFRPKSFQRLTCGPVCYHKRRTKKERERYHKNQPGKTIRTSTTRCCEECHQYFMTKKHDQYVCNTCKPEWKKQRRIDIKKSKKHPPIV